MEFANFEEFWKALGRLYDDTLRINEAIDKLREEQRESANELRDSLKDLRDATGNLLRAVEKQQAVLESPERRLDRTEITVEAVLEDLRRHREGHSPQ
jgi:DNA anti-recombination protein RmuC